jgi:hypothetical protein
MVGRAGFEPATFESGEHKAQPVSRCKRDIIAGLDYRPIAFSKVSIEIKELLNVEWLSDGSPDGSCQV